MEEDQEDPALTRAKKLLDGMVEDECSETVVETQRQKIRDLIKKAETGALANLSGLHTARWKRQTTFTKNQLKAKENLQVAFEEQEMCRNSRTKRLKLAQDIFEQSSRDINGQFDKLDEEAQSKITRLQDQMDKHQQRHDENMAKLRATADKHTKLGHAEVGAATGVDGVQLPGVYYIIREQMHQDTILADVRNDPDLREATPEQQLAVMNLMLNAMNQRAVKAPTKNDTSQQKGDATPQALQKRPISVYSPAEMGIIQQLHEDYRREPQSH